MSICVLYLCVYPRSGYGPVDFIDLWFSYPFFCQSNSITNFLPAVSDRFGKIFPFFARRVELRYIEKPFADVLRIALFFLKGAFDGPLGIHPTNAGAFFLYPDRIPHANERRRYRFRK